MPTRTRKIASFIIRLVPPARYYVQEKNELRAALGIQQQHISNLERDLRQQQKKVEERADTSPKIRLVANQLDATGAPLIFMDIVKDMTAAYPDLFADFITFAPVDEGYAEKIKSWGLDILVFENRDTELKLVSGDVVVLNTAAHSAELKNSIYQALNDERLRKLIWYIHEDWPEIFFDEKERKTIRRLIDEGKISIYIPARKAQHNHEKLYAGRGNTKLLPYRIKLPQKYHQVLQPDDFNKLNFVMVGKTGEGIKGHLPILYAFLDFYDEYYKKQKQKYRDFELRFIAVERDYLSLQILRHAKALGKHFKYYPPLKHDEALDTMKNSNVTICYSMRECLPIFVFEGMTMGHVVLRNDVSGLEEQLRDGQNGFLLDSDNYQQVKDVIEKLMNRSKVTDTQLAKMSVTSNAIAEDQANISYQKLIQEARNSYKNSEG